jgi:hypothetical protein
MIYVHNIDESDQFLERRCVRLIQEEIDYIKSPISIKEMEYMTVTFLNRKHQMNSPVNFTNSLQSLSEN